MTTTPTTPVGETATDRTAPTFWSSVRLVAVREITSKLRSKTFVGMFGVLVVLVAAGTIVPNVIGGEDAAPVAIVGQAPADVGALEDLEDLDGVPYLDVVEENVSLDEAKTLLTDGDIEAALVFKGDQVTVWGYDAPPERAVEALSSAPQVELVDADAPNPQVLYFVTILFALAFFMAAMTFGQQIAASVVEEKQTRIVEILLSAVSARALLTGKVLGNAALAFGQVALLAGVALVGLGATGQRIGVPDLGPAIAWYLPFFLIGFLMIAAMFAAAGAMVSRSEDIGAVTTPITMLIMVPYLLVFFVSESDLWMRVLSWIPFSAPIAMPIQIYAERAAWWEPIGSLIVLALTTVAIVYAAERIYRNSLLRTGTRVKLGQALHPEG